MKTNEEKAMINKNDVLVLQHIMALNKCDLMSAVKFAGHNQTCYHLAMAVAQAKDEEFKAEKQQWIDKACEWLKENASKHIHGPAYMFYKESMIEEFKQAMEGGKK